MFCFVLFVSLYGTRSGDDWTLASPITTTASVVLLTCPGDFALWILRSCDSNLAHFRSCDSSCSDSSKPALHALERSRRLLSNATSARCHLLVIVEIWSDKIWWAGQTHFGLLSAKPTSRLPNHFVLAKSTCYTFKSTRTCACYDSAAVCRGVDQILVTGSESDASRTLNGTLDTAASPSRIFSL